MRAPGSSRPSRSARIARAGRRARCCDRGLGRPARRPCSPIGARTRVLAAELARPTNRATIEFLTGGVSSIVIRVVTDEGAFVIKQALPQLRVEAAWYSRPERSLIEARCALASWQTWFRGRSRRSLRLVPDRNAFVMRSAPAGYRDVEGSAPPWRGLAPMSRRRSDGCSDGSDAASAPRRRPRRDFADTSFFDELRIDPYLRYVAARTPDLAPALDALADGPSHDRGVPGPWRLQPEEPPRHARRSASCSSTTRSHTGAIRRSMSAFVTSHLCLKAIRFRAAGHAERVSRRRRRVLDAYAAEARQLGWGRAGSRCGRRRASARAGRREVSGRVPDRRTDRALARALGGEALLDPPRDQRHSWARPIGPGRSKDRRCADLRIARVVAREILDSRGRPTVEADVVLANGLVGRAPSRPAHRRERMRLSTPRRRPGAIPRSWRPSGRRQCRSSHRPGRPRSRGRRPGRSSTAA